MIIKLIGEMATHRISLSNLAAIIERNNGRSLTLVYAGSSDIRHVISFYDRAERDQALHVLDNALINTTHVVAKLIDGADAIEHLNNQVG